MDLFSLLTLLCLAEVVCTGTHSLWYFVTLTAGPSPFPEMVIVGMVDDVPVEYYDSAERIMTSRWHWNKEEGDMPCAQIKSLAIAHVAHGLKNKLQHMMKHFNHSVSLHTYQRITGCELDDDGTERFRGKDSYNGKDVLIYDIQSYTWSSLVPEIRVEYWMMESSKRRLQQLYQPTCILTLKSYLNQEGSILKQRVSPRVRLLRKQVGGAGDVQVTCMATGFYPRHIELTLKRDKQPIPEQELIGGDVLPNGDGTYQLRISLSVSAEEMREGHRYSCSVKHVSMDNKLDIAWELQPKPDIAMISGASVAALSIILLIVTGIFIFKKRKSKDPGSSKSEKNKGEVERLNAAEEEAKDAGGGAEMERQDE